MLCGMRRHIALVLLLAGLAGCKSLFAAQGLPDDPLFVHRKPLEVKADSTRPTVLVYSEPSPPANPYFAQDRPGLAGPPKTPGVPGILTNRPRIEPVEKE